MFTDEFCILCGHVVYGEVVNLDPECCGWKIQLVWRDSWDPVFEDKVFSFNIPGTWGDGLQEVIFCGKFEQEGVLAKGCYW